MVPARVLHDSGFEAPSVNIAFTVVYFAESTALRAISKRRMPQDALSLNDDRISDADHVEIPCGVVGTEVDAAVADVRIAL
jgi:hypothetical protein